MGWSNLRWRYAAIGLAAVVGYASISLLLEAGGSLSASLRRDPEVWGTYGEWAAAIVPLLAVLGSVDLWMRERRVAAKSYANSLVVGIVVENRYGVNWLVNDSLRPIFHHGRSIPVGSERQNITVGDLIRTADGSEWKVDAQLNLEPA